MLPIVDPLLDPLLAPLRRPVAARLTHMFGRDRFPQEQYGEPAGDPGLFGPDSVTWRVHADPSMIVGGLAALMLQALHPLAMAGVAEHSNYKERPLERLSRTASFVGATTYASTEVALSIIAVVKAVHEHVRGVAPDGRPYSAGDPELLRWVHVAEASSFLRAHRRYHPFPVRGGDVDRYFDEMAVIAEELGATDVPRSRDEVVAYLRAIRPELVAGDQAQEALRWLMEPIGSDPVTRNLSRVLLMAGLGLLPAWVRELYGVSQPDVVELTAVRPVAFTLLSALRTLQGEPPALIEARRRCAQPSAPAA